MNKKGNNNDLKAGVRAYYGAQRLAPDRTERILNSAGAGDPPRNVHWRPPQWVAAAAVLIVMSGGIALWRATPVYATGRVTAEAVQRHRKAHAPEVHGDCLDRVGAGLDRLDFSLKPSSERSLPGNLTVVGGRYCRIQGRPAAQILLEDADGRRCTLIVALTEDSRLARVRGGLHEKDGVRVRIWHDAGRIFVLAV